MARQRKRKGEPVHGWLAIDKPVEVTSTEVVSRLKRLFNAQKVGHGGTLDPLADGILPIAFGEATKTVQWAMDARKEYVFTIFWGASTTTQDREGEVTATSAVRPSREAVEATLAGFVGEIEQVPPKFSAIKVDGQRAYDLAREGEAFELEARPVVLHEAVVIAMPDADRTVIRLLTGKGFYVRALVRDLAFDLGTEGHITALRRTRVGVLDETVAVPLSGIEALDCREARLAALLPIETVLDDVPGVDVDGPAAAEIRQGRTVVLLPHVVERWRAERPADPDDRRALAFSGDQAIALGEVRAGRFQPTRVFQV